MVTTVNRIPKTVRTRSCMATEDTVVGQFLEGVREKASTEKPVVAATHKNPVSAKNRRGYIMRNMDRYLTPADKKARKSFWVTTRGNVLYAFFGKEEEYIARMSEDI